MILHYLIVLVSLKFCPAGLFTIKIMCLLNRHINLNPNISLELRCRPLLQQF